MDSPQGEGDDRGAVGAQVCLRLSCLESGHTASYQNKNIQMRQMDTSPLTRFIAKYTRHNQTRAAQVLGLNRGTLRKKLKQYGLL